MLRGRRLAQQPPVVRALVGQGRIAGRQEGRMLQLPTPASSRITVRLLHSWGRPQRSGLDMQGRTASQGSQRARTTYALTFLANRSRVRLSGIGCKGRAGYPHHVCPDVPGEQGRVARLGLARRVRG